MITIKDIARETGYSICTVSCALRGLASVPPRTRKMICEAAARLGYQPNSAAALLVRQRHRKVSEALRVPVAMLGAGGPGRGRSFLSFCEERGLDGRFCRLDAASDPCGELDRLWNEGVQGLYVASTRLDLQATRRLESCDFARFAVVKETRAHPGLRFHLVRHSAFDFMLTTLCRVFSAGYRRVFVLATASASEEDDLARIGAVAAFRLKRMPSGARLRIEVPPRGAEEPAVRRAIRAKPDAIIGFPFTWYYELCKAGVSIPGDMGFATLLTYTNLPGIPVLSGCDAADDELLRRGLHRIYSLLETGEFGFVDKPTEDVIEPVWIEGETLPVQRT